MVIYSEKDNQPCSDADRTTGEGVEIKELKIAFVTLGINGYVVTYDPSAPIDKEIVSKKFTPMYMLYNKNDNNSYDLEQIIDKADILKICEKKYIIASHLFCRNSTHQPINKQKIFDCFNNSSNEIEWSFSNHYDEMDKTDLSHGSGIYTSNPNLDWQPYFEQESMVISRSGDECIVAETDQWYIMYDNPEWQKSVYDHVANEVGFTDQTVRDLLLGTIKKSHPWPCSRTFGMGSRIPFDEKYLIDSLSDSTIYMAYYTVSHLITQLPSSVLSDDIWESIFFGKQCDASQKYPELFSKMTNEFAYWYPVDLRVSGKDLITNHLTMMFFNHMAIFGPELMPKTIYANGHIMFNGEKMSKSKGNFITLGQAIEKYGINVTRFIAATAGDDTIDGNFNESEVNPCILSMYAEIQNWSKTDITKMRTDSYQFMDHMQMISLNEILNKVASAYSDMRFRDVIKYGFHTMMYINYFCKRN